MEQIFILVIIVFLYILAFYCYYKLNDFDIRRAFYAGKGKKVIYPKIILQFFIICIIFFSLVYMISTLWR